MLRYLTSVVLAAAAAYASGALAEEFLDKERLGALIAGNTVHTEDLQSGRSFLAYHHPGGGWILRREDGSTIDGIWRISADGAQCVVIDAETCGRIRKNADGTYTRVVNGAPRNKWTKVTPGKAF
jgi:hypothetical protein